MAVAQALDSLSAPATDRIMSIDAAGYRYWTGRGGVVLVNDPLPAIRQVAAAYDIRWLVLERDDAVAAVAPILDGSSGPSWVGAPVFVATAPDATLPFVHVGLYPVCLAPTDTRCEP